MENTKRLSPLESLVNSLKSVSPIVGGIIAALYLYGSIPRANSEKESRLSTPSAIETSCDQSNPNYPVMSTAGGDEYTEGIYMDIRDKIEFIFKGDRNLSFEIRPGFDYKQTAPSKDTIQIQKQDPKSAPKQNYDTRKSGKRSYAKISKGKVRNNNPGNVKAIPGKPWAGQIGKDYRGFAIFKNEIYGIRAAIKNVRDYGKVYGTNNLRDLVEKYAPRNENNTNSYISSLSERTGYHPDQELDFTNKRVAAEVVNHMFTNESGAFYSNDKIEKALALIN